MSQKQPDQLQDTPTESVEAKKQIVVEEVEDQKRVARAGLER